MVQAIQPPTEENSTTQHHQKDLMWPMQHPCQQFEISLRKQTAKITENHSKMEPKIFKNASKIEFMRLPRASCEPTCSRTRFGIDFGCHLDASWGRPGDLLGTILVSFWRRFWRPFSIPLRSSIFINLGCILASISASISQPFVNIFLLWRSARNAVNSSKNQGFWCLQHHVFHRFWDRFSNLDARSRFDLKKLSFGLRFGSVLGSFWRAEGYQFRIENSTWFPCVFMTILEGGRICDNMVRGG